MRQATMDRWIEAAEANRFCLVAQQTRARPIEQTPLTNSLLMRLRSMVRPVTSHQCAVHVSITPSSAA
jgi:hypothetical protein